MRKNKAAAFTAFCRFLPEYVAPVYA